jgi:phenylacetate-coenzyme A ligase PaaK-like adenylate-forming protein
MMRLSEGGAAMYNPEQVIEQLRAENQDLRSQLDRALKHSEVYRKALEKHLPVYEGDETEFEEILAHPDRYESMADILKQLAAERKT